jgi:hypothetical protein
MFRSVLDVAEEQETLQRKNEQDIKRMDEQELLFIQRREDEERRREKIRKQLEERELARLDSAGEDLTASARKHLQVQNAKNYVNAQMNAIEMSPVISSHIVEGARSTYRSSSSSRDSEAAETVSSVRVDVHRDPSPRASTQVTSRDKGVRTLTKKFEPSSGSTTNLLNNMQPPSHDPVVRSENRSTPKAIVQPRVQAPHIVTIDITNTNPKPAKNRHLSPHTNTDFNANSHRSPNARKAAKSPQKSTLNIETIDDVPKDIEPLTVEDVCKCLSLLNMEGHQNNFTKHQVDGNLLLSLKETVLINDFKFTPFHASKLMRFIRGWRPKLA